jgi:glutathione S-transferase
MKLRYSPASPFVRKVTVFAHETGLNDRIIRVDTDVWDPSTDIAVDNPLGKVPALITDSGLFVGSTLICEYLDSLHAGPSLFPGGDRRWPTLQFLALADGIIEAAVAHVVESIRRPKQFVYSGHLTRQQDKIIRTLDVIEAKNAPDLDVYRTIATITLGCALGYLDFRLPKIEWRKTRPGLAAWYKDASQRPSMQETIPYIP